MYDQKKEYLGAWDRAAKRSGFHPDLLACYDYRARHAKNWAKTGFFLDAIKILNEISRETNDHQSV